MNAVNHLSGYRIVEQLYAGSRTLVYRGVCDQDQTPVVIKLLRNPFPSFNDLILFRNQYTIARNLDLPGVVKPLALEPHKNSYALIMEDFGGISLKTMLSQLGNLGGQSQNLLTFLNISLQIATILDGLYHQRVIHKDIKPANLLIHPVTHQVKLIDFSISSLLSRETQEVQTANALEGTLAYLSPEQTGRMNRGIDYRSDFYSLGVTFYELLTGQLPFTSHDPMELVHCHLARQPMPVEHLNPALPTALAEIIRRLMAKNAEDRYQSASGLHHDLEQCLIQLQTTGQIAPFELGQQDLCDRFLIPEKLYGRQTEVAGLLQAFDRVSLGATEMVLVAGFSGIGKTAVVNEVHKPIVKQRGYFIKGKYDQFQRDIPFSACLQAFRDLIGQLLAESDAQLQCWKTKILDAVGDNGQVLVEVIPELERIIGPQAATPELTGIASENRFNLLLQKFVQVFTTADHPLVLFLDDLQWADSASLKLLQLLMQDAGYLLVIGAYRDNEVSPAHPLMLTLDGIQKSGATVQTIVLQALAPEDMNYLVADTLNCDRALAQPLTELVRQKTQGNPFFATQFLKALHEDGLITFNWEVRHWQCDIAEVRTLALTDDVVEFMARQLQKLPAATQDALKLAACIGAQFDLQTLGIVSETSPEQTASALWRALQEGLILPLTDVYKFFTQMDTPSATPSTVNVTYRFLHDRVQQAAYSLIPEEQKQATHLKIGQLLLENTSVTEREETLFAIVNQLNMGRRLLPATSEPDQLVQLNLAAARKAKAATAYRAAIQYLDICLERLPKGSWQLQPELTRSIYEEAAEAAYLSTDYERMEQLAAIVLAHTNDLLDKVRIYEIKMLAAKGQGQLRTSIQIGLQLLELLGVTFPAEPTLADVGQALDTTLQAWKDRPIASLLDGPVMTDPIKLAAMRILTQLIAPAYQSMPMLMPLFIFEQINLSIAYGNCAISAFSYADYGLVLCGIVGDLEAGYQFGQLALNILDRFQSKATRCRTFFIVYSYISHWKEPLRNHLSELQDAYQVGLETGDLESSALNAQMYCAYAYFAGHELSTLATEMAAYRQGLLQLKQEGPLNFQAIYHQTVLNLLGQAADDPCRLEGEVFAETQAVPVLQAANIRAALYYLYYNKMVLCYLLGDSPQAAANAPLVESYADSMVGMFAIPLFCFYRSLVDLALLPAMAEPERTQALERVAHHQEKLQQWADHVPANHLHRFHLVEAERQRVLGNKAATIDHYDRAIQLAQTYGYIQDEALAYELAAQFYLAWDKEQLAQSYMTQAYYAYSRWGAKVKVENLEQRYPQLLAPMLQKQQQAFNVTETILATSSHTSKASTSGSSGALEVLDLNTILKVFQMISSEIELEKLLSTLLQVVLENAGADQCALLMPRDGSWVIEALAQFEQPDRILQSLPMESSQAVPVSLINTVKHTLKPSVIWNVVAHPTLAADPYILRHTPKSLLCMPILHQGQLIGILYLENNLTIGAFTDDRIELLNLICTQTAISLENARLYQKTQQAFTDLKQAQLQMIQSEKMSALGNLVAGVAHEINNPVGFLSGNIQPALDYIQDIFGLLDLYQQKYPQADADIDAEIETIDLDYIREDLPKLVGSMREGVKRIRDISTSLRTFSRADSDRPIPYDLRDGIDSTILILKHRLKANEHRPEIQVMTDYGPLPAVECFAGQLNQVFMNLLANAIDALEEASHGRSFEDIQAQPNQIIVQTHLSEDGQQAVIRIKDNGIGIPDEVKQRIFDHLFTTKGVERGTGLGLTIARQIVVEKHGGMLEVTSKPGEGTEFLIAIPVRVSLTKEAQPVVMAQ
ncbi:serine/threonine protein kinase [Leptolyngbya sp. 'hensonii']|uniref:trifunctional serine/threonine-protein kinase/ATP-binding protein/sensor histidine kinase n=1 Tax=Leptolyngbya sp. 'hensonii' TaxID=1922337 RepID=UPI00094FD75E|nr:ATP-binding sensor histidine kinase [Leptolyngbya sp. 'hensonii']OLP18053.1 serine/threonine protein kinase [Leptolyngbya sp. 'hensonii']